jgi:hypothetical protein
LSKTPIHSFHKPLHNITPSPLHVTWLTTLLSFLSLIALHGFHSPSEKSWGSEKKSSWLKDLVVTRNWQARIVQYGWGPADLAEGLYTRLAIRRAALKLLVKLKELRKGQETVGWSSWMISRLVADV